MTITGENIKMTKILFYRFNVHVIFNRGCLLLFYIVVCWVGRKLFFTNMFYMLQENLEANVFLKSQNAYYSNEKCIKFMFF